MKDCQLVLLRNEFLVRKVNLHCLFLGMSMKVEQSTGQDVLNAVASLKRKREKFGSAIENKKETIMSDMDQSVLAMLRREEEMAKVGHEERTYT